MQRLYDLFSLPGKSVVLLALLGFIDLRYFVIALENNLGSHIEKLCRENDRYVQQCVHTTVRGAALKSRILTVLESRHG